jgi:general L-amino acid transport system permease protein
MWWRDRRFWFIFSQVLAVILLAIAIFLLWGNLDRNLKQLGIKLGFGFLSSQASFEIGEKPIAYNAADPYSRALLVGLVNSLRVTIVGLVLATVVGISIGVARLSNNWLVRQLALVYVEVLRNTPLLLQLFFWYFVVFIPQFRSHLTRVQNAQIEDKLPFSPEFSTLLLGLTLYTAAFIAEIVRGGIQSVPKGQWEAARSLGLKPSLVMRLVVFPQALRVIIPPLTSQYLNLAKNSSLAIAVGYPDIYFVASTTFNQTGKAVEIMLLLMLAYLSISLIISLAMNWLNRSVQIKER